MALQWRWKLYNANAGKSGVMAAVRQQAIEIYLEKKNMSIKLARY
jgi:hypothetical protein